MHPAFTGRFIMLIYLIALLNDSVCSNTYASCVNSSFQNNSATFCDWPPSAFISSMGMAKIFIALIYSKIHFLKISNVIFICRTHFHWGQVGDLSVSIYRPVVRSTHRSVFGSALEIPEVPCMNKTSARKRPTSAFIVKEQPM